MQSGNQNFTGNSPYEDPSIQERISNYIDSKLAGPGLAGAFAGLVSNGVRPTNLGAALVGLASTSGALIGDTFFTKLPKDVVLYSALSAGLTAGIFHKVSYQPYIKLMDSFNKGVNRYAATTTIGQATRTRKILDGIAKVVTSPTASRLLYGFAIGSIVSSVYKTTRSEMINYRLRAQDKADQHERESRKERVQASNDIDSSFSQVSTNISGFIEKLPASFSQIR